MRLARPAVSPLGVSLGFAALALACLPVADLHVTTLHPLAEMGRLLGGLIRPDFPAVEGWSVAYTVAFAVLGVGLGAGAGLLLAIPFARSRTLRLACASLRSVHELFWALLLMQVFGLSSTTGVLAIGLPYAGICAKVFSEIVEEADLSALRVLPPGTGLVSAFAYARLPDLAGRFSDYTLYRLECGLRSSLVLGFIGLPTMGFALESAFRQGRYAEAGALLLVFYALIGSRRGAGACRSCSSGPCSPCRRPSAARRWARASCASSPTTSCRRRSGPRPGQGPPSGVGSGRS